MTSQFRGSLPKTLPDKKMNKNLENRK